MAATKEHRLSDTPWLILHVQMALCEKFWRCMTWNIFTDLGPSSSQPGYNKISLVLPKLTWFNPYTRCAHNALFASFLPPNRFFCFDPRANAVSACPHKRFFSFFFSFGILHATCCRDIEKRKKNLNFCGRKSTASVLLIRAHVYSEEMLTIDFA